MDISKAGWVHRLNRSMNQWRSCWLVMYRNGQMASFESPNNQRPEIVFYLNDRLLSVRRGTELVNVPIAPSQRSTESIVQLYAINGEEMFVFCAESPDDAMAWCLSLNNMLNTSRPSFTNVQSGVRNVQYPTVTNYTQPNAIILSHPRGYGSSLGFGPGIGFGRRRSWGCHRRGWGRGCHGGWRRGGCWW